MAHHRIAAFPVGLQPLGLLGVHPVLRPRPHFHLHDFFGQQGGVLERRRRRHAEVEFAAVFAELGPGVFADAPAFGLCGQEGATGIGQHTGDELGIRPVVQLPGADAGLGGVGIRKESGLAALVVEDELGKFPLFGLKQGAQAALPTIEAVHSGNKGRVAARAVQQQRGAAFGEAVLPHEGHGVVPAGGQFAQYQAGAVFLGVLFFGLFGFFLRSGFGGFGAVGRGGFRTGSSFFFGFFFFCRFQLIGKPARPFFRQGVTAHLGDFGQRSRSQRIHPQRVFGQIFVLHLAAALRLERIERGFYFENEVLPVVRKFRLGGPFEGRGLRRAGIPEAKRVVALGRGCEQVGYPLAVGRDLLALDLAPAVYVGNFERAFYHSRSRRLNCVFFGGVLGEKQGGQEEDE